MRKLVLRNYEATNFYHEMQDVAAAIVSRCGYAEDEAEAIREIKGTAERTATEEEREAIISAYSSDEGRISFFEALYYFAQDVTNSCDLEEEPASYEEFMGLAGCDACTSYGAGNFYFLVSFGDWESDPIMGCDDAEEAIAYAYGSYLRAKGASL